MSALVERQSRARVTVPKRELRMIGACLRGPCEPDLGGLDASILPLSPDEALVELNQTNTYIKSLASDVESFVAGATASTTLVDFLNSFRAWIQGWQGFLDAIPTGFTTTPLLWEMAPSLRDGALAYRAQADDFRKRFQALGGPTTLGPPPAPSPQGSGITDILKAATWAAVAFAGVYVGVSAYGAYRRSKGLGDARRRR